MDRRDRELFQLPVTDNTKLRFLCHRAALPAKLGTSIGTSYQISLQRCYRVDGAFLPKCARARDGAFGAAIFLHDTRTGSRQG
jgi:hypothetical protein